MTHAQENMQSIETVLEQAQRLDLLHKIFNQLFSTYAKNQSQTMPKELKGKYNNNVYQLGKTNKRDGNYFKSRNYGVEKYNTEMKNSLEEFNIRFELA